MTDPERIQSTLELIHRYGGTEEGHHAAWVIDQVVRILTGEQYAQWVAEHNLGEEGPNTYEWNEGIAP